MKPKLIIPMLKAVLMFWAVLLIFRGMPDSVFGADEQDIEKQIHLKENSKYGVGDVEVHLNGGDDVAYIGDTNTVEIWIKNDAALNGLSLPFEFSIGRNYQFDSTYGTFGYVNPEGDAVGAFDLIHMDSGIVDNLTADTIWIIGAAMPGKGLPVHTTHSLCYTMTVYIPPGQAELLNGFSIDNIFIPPNGGWAFDDFSTYAPDFQGNSNASDNNPDAPPVYFDIVRRFGNVEVHLNGGDDVAYIGDTNTVEIWISNDDTIMGLSLPFEFSIGRNYQFDSTYGTLGYVNPEGDAVGKFILIHKDSGNIDNMAADSIMILGAALAQTDGLPVHDTLSLCYTMKVYIPPGQADLPDGFAVDNIFYPMTGIWAFMEWPLGDYAPDFQGNSNASENNPDAPPVYFDIVDTSTTSDRCYTLKYYENVVTSFAAPNPFSGDTVFAQTFTTGIKSRLMSVDIGLSDPGDGTFGNDDVYISLYKSFNTAFPQTLIRSDTLDSATYVAYPSMTLQTYFDSTIEFKGDFFVAFSTNATASSGDYEYISGSDGTDGLQRSWGYDANSWALMKTRLGIDANLVIDARLCVTDPDTCIDCRDKYPDYTPSGLPDFDQKRSMWIDGNGHYSYCGPVALANCLWWLDSKGQFLIDENSPPPPSISDDYSLVSSYGSWDDHDSANVVPLINNLAAYLKTGPFTGGTWLQDFYYGTLDWLDSCELAPYYTVSVIIRPSFSTIYTYAFMDSTDVIVLLGFYQVIGEQYCYCERMGGHYVTASGVAIEGLDWRICISDPYHDRHECNNLSIHGPDVHDNVFFVSGPHTTYYHDHYETQVAPPCINLSPMPQTEIVEYIDDSATVAQFHNYNYSIPIEEHYDTLQDPEIDTLTFVDAIVVIVMDSCSNQVPGDGNNDGIINDGDLDFLDDYINHGGPAPPVPSNADPNGDCQINQSDIDYLNEYLNQGGPAPVFCTCVYPTLGDFVCGDANSDETVNILDITYLIAYLYKDGPAPDPIEFSDVNNDGAVNILDITYLIAYLYKNGPEPVCP